MILIPALALLGAAAWFAFGRRPQDEELRAIVVDEREPVHATTATFVAFHPEPLERVIKLDVAELDAETIVLDQEAIKLDAPIDIEKPLS
jgi:hypothetical protein